MYCPIEGDDRYPALNLSFLFVKPSSNPLTNLLNHSAPHGIPADIDRKDPAYWKWSTSMLVFFLLCFFALLLFEILAGQVGSRSLGDGFVERSKQVRTSCRQSGCIKYAGRIGRPV